MVDYEMCVHVFGGTSSFSCCNYALSKTAVVNASDVKSEVAKTLMKHFYVESLNLSNLKTQQSISYKKFMVVST